MHKIWIRECSKTNILLVRLLTYGSAGIAPDGISGFYSVYGMAKKEANGKRVYIKPELCLSGVRTRVQRKTVPQMRFKEQESSVLTRNNNYRVI